MGIIWNDLEGTDVVCIIIGMDFIHLLHMGAGKTSLMCF